MRREHLIDARLLNAAIYGDPLKSNDYSNLSDSIDRNCL